MKNNRVTAARRFAGGSVLLSIALLFGGCDNMKKQDSLRADQASARLPRGASAHLPPPRTVPHRVTIADGAFSTGERDGQLLSEIPLQITPALLARGRERFEIYCSVCHGPDGYGRGIVVRRGFPAPPSYHDSRLRTAPAGHFFRVMTRGFGVMYSYADRLTAEDRWAVVAYIRALQLSQHARASDLGDAERAQLASLPR